MKNSLFLITLLFKSLAVFSQIDCSNGLFLDSIYGVKITKDIVYGSNYNYDGSLRTLKLDVYEPLNDNSLTRPLILFAPKGSFLQEDKAEHSMLRLCNYFASRGYTVVSLDYRVGVNYMAVMQNPEYEFAKAVLRAAHDYKAAIRFFRKDASSLNTYKVDTNIIIAGGSSAGAITALQLTYLNKETEIPAGFDTTGLGGQEGNSGNTGFSSRPHFVVNLCGAISDTSWIEQNDIPIISMHGNLDTEVPYSTGTVSMIIPITELSGSYTINQRCNNTNTENPFYTFYGQQHIPYDENAGGDYELYMDTVLRFVSNNLYPWVCSRINSVNTKVQSNKLYTIKYIGEYLTITNNTTKPLLISLIDVLGRIIEEKFVFPSSEIRLNIIEIKHLPLILKTTNEGVVTSYEKLLIK